MPDVIPYLPSLGDCRRWMALRVAGLDTAEAWRRAVPLPGRSDASGRRHALRALTRTLVAGAHGQEPVTLTVPLVGGASAVKRGDTEAWRVSMHGDWIRRHRGALLTAYSATPYYTHFMPLLDDVYASMREGDAFAGFSTALFSVVEKVPGMESVEWLGDLRSDPRARCICREKSAGLHTSLSVFDVIFKRGPELPLILMHSTPDDAVELTGTH